MNDKFQLVLASQSPRRKELLQDTYLNFVIEPSHNEEITQEVSPKLIVEDLAKQKAYDVWKSTKYANPFILAADTVVVFNDTILGKPKDKADAAKTLMSLSNQKHYVFTGVCLKTKDNERVFSICTEVLFDQISSDLLDLYLATNDSLDKAGAYGIQKFSQGFIKKIDGSYSNVVGLPVQQVLQEIKTFFPIETRESGEWRNYFV